jgi:hypothetical protein
MPKVSSNAALPCEYKWFVGEAINVAAKGPIIIGLLMDQRYMS